MASLLARNQLDSTKSTLPIAIISVVKEFEIPSRYLADKNRPRALVSWWFHCLEEVRKSSDLPFRAQLRPAKLLVDKYGFEESALAVRRLVGGKYTPTLWGILRKPRWAGLEE